MENAIFINDSDKELIIGQNPAMQNIAKLISNVAKNDTTVLISGETGTGKEMLARAIHNQSNRCDKPFIAVDCGGLPGSLFENELFGHDKGSYTSADQTKYGRFEAANGGTIFLDEITNIDIETQSKLLRVLQEKEINRVGSSKTVKIDVRIIAATNKDLRKCIEEGTFRRDLFYRINVFPVSIPPLRRRREDIPVLANYFLKKCRKVLKKENIRDITETAMEILTEYEWPGNVRELENIIERAVILAKGTTIEPIHVFYYSFSDEAVIASPTGELKSLAEIERSHIEKTLRVVKGCKGKAAQILGIDPKTLWLKLQKYANVTR